MILSSCAPKTVTVEVPKSEPVFYIPKKIEQPKKPRFEQLDTTASWSTPDNFKKIQKNFSLYKNYVSNLKSTISYYELCIDSLEAEKTKYESSQK